MLKHETQTHLILFKYHHEKINVTNLTSKKIISRVI